MIQTHCLNPSIFQSMLYCLLHCATSCGVSLLSYGVSYAVSCYPEVDAYKLGRCQTERKTEIISITKIDNTLEYELKERKSLNRE